MSEHDERLNNLEEKVDKIMTNHLPHIQVALEGLSLQMKGVLWGIKIIGGTIITALVGAIMVLITK